MRHARITAVLACVLAGGCTPQLAAQPASTPSSTTGRIDAATAALVDLTCGELSQLLKAKDKRGGLAILWLDYYYTRRVGLPDWTADWVKTVAQGVGGTCAIDVNSSRTVLDVIAQMHREYGGAMPARP